MAFLDRFRKSKPSTTPRGGSGRINVGGFLQLEEQNAELIGTQGLRVFDRMYRTDPDVRRCVWMIANPIIGGTWSVAPYGGDEATPGDKEAADATEWALFEFMRPGFRGHLAQALPLTIRSGFAPFEQVWERTAWNGRDLLAPKTLGVRLPRTIHRWLQDGDELTAIEQFLPTAGMVEIPAEDVVYYRFGAEGDNWEGLSLLRAAFKPWLLKEQLEKIDAIAKERQAVGVPVVYPPKDANPSQLEAMDDILRNLRTGEEGFVRMPGPHAQDLGPEIASQGWRLDIVSHNAGEQADPHSSLQYHSDKVAAAFLADFMRLGQGQSRGSGGSRSTAQVQQNPFLAAVEAIAGEIEATINESVIERFVALNFAVDEPPKLSMSLVDSTTLEELAAYVQQLVAAGVLEPDADLEDFLRQRADLPPANAAERAAREKAKAEAIANPPKPEPPAPGEPPVPAPKPPTPAPAPTPPAKTPEREEPELADRDARWWEQAMELDTIESAITGAREQFQSAAGAPMRALAQDLAARAVKGRSAPAKPPGELVDALLVEMKDLYGSGRSTVRRELEAQRGGSTALVTSDAAEGRSLKELRQRATLAAHSIAARIWQAVSRATLGGAASPADVQAAGELEGNAALRGEAILHAAPALNLGRGDEADAHADEIVGSRYTSILDPNRCRMCASADDDVLRPLDDPVRVARKPPNPLCEGGNRCRCMEFFQLEAEAPGSGGGTPPVNPLEPQPGTGDLPSQHFDVSGGSAELRDLVDGQLAAIDRVHSFPENLANVPIQIQAMPDGEFGSYSFGLRLVAREVINQRINLSRTALGANPPITSAVHEVGHMLDANGFGAGPDIEAWLAGEDLSSGGATLAEWRQAALSSASYANLVASRDPGEVEYETLTREVFARSYEQWIALRSGDEVLAAKIAARREDDPDLYWDDVDFRPIAAALDRFFTTRGLRT